MSGLLVLLAAAALLACSSKPTSTPHPEPRPKATPQPRPEPQPRPDPQLPPPPELPADPGGDTPTCRTAVTNFFRASELDIDEEGLELSDAWCERKKWAKDVILCVTIARGKHGIAACGQRFAAVTEFLDALKFQQRERTTHELEELYWGAWFVWKYRPGADGKRQFPAGKVGPTPAIGMCCESGGGKCYSNSNDWDHLIWKALRFEVLDKDVYSYEYSAPRPDQSFVIKAFADLDCDGKPATWEVRGDAKDMAAAVDPVIRQTAND